MTAVKSKYGGSNSIYSMSAEWRGHIIFSPTNDPDIDLNSMDPRFVYMIETVGLMVLGSL
ncbi:MAG: hypothetical protein M0Q88_07390 [Bacilli bacterium]|nr:hypothetical protein [Bacilli bacterium]